MKNCPKIYTGQALAISMIVLVVCAILGISIYSRVMKDQALVAEEAISSEVLEMADSILGTMTAVSASDLKDLIEQNEGDIKITGWTDVNQFFEDLKLVNLTDTLSDLDQCDSNNSEIELTVVNATIDDLIEVSVDEAKGFRIEGKGLASGASTCNLKIYTESRGTTKSGFVVKKIYGKGYSTGSIKYKMYSENDIELYCFSDDLTSCNSSDFTPDANWNYISDKSTQTFNLMEKSGTYSLDEIRIIPMGGTVGIGVSLDPAGCLKDEEIGSVKVVANVTCNGIYRAKEMYVPEAGSVSYSSMFDFTIYNNVGILDL
jgi:hypothetical protein